ncbi:hypoxanthine phosphoribosyltransferase [bacterium]|nr:MAG: hypoxanthine phosphoribosyltransferase [bacterium]
MELPPYKILISQEQISERISRLADDISKELKNDNPLVVVVLKGAFIFAADLIRHFDFPHQIDFISISSYGYETKTTGVVKILKDLDEPIKGRTVLIIEDIIDTGLTLDYIYKLFQIREPKKIEIAVFLSKMARREYKIPVKFIGFEVPNKFVVGYGLDYKQKYRSLPYIIGIEEE